MTITAYIPCHNNETTIGQAAAALRKQTRPADQYLFINDRCTDRSPDIAREHGFTVVDLVGKKGLAAGRNLALQLCASDVLFGVDADVAAEETYLQRLEEAFARHPQAVAIGGRLDERFTQTAPDLWRAMHLPQHHGDAELLNPRLIYGSTMACRAEAVRRLGGWNEQFQSNFEDYELSQRFKTARLPYVYTPSCRAWHLRRDTLDSVLRTHWNWNYFGYERYYATAAKWLEGRLPRIWNSYRNRRVIDLKHPQLTPITLLFPWSWMIRDLYALRKSIGYFGDIATVLTIADDIFTRFGADENIRGQPRQFLGKLINGLEDTPTRGPLAAEVFHRIMYHALESIPNANYWQACRAAGASA